MRPLASYTALRILVTRQRLLRDFCSLTAGGVYQKGAAEQLCWTGLKSANKIKHVRCEDPGSERNPRLKLSNCVRHNISLSRPAASVLQHCDSCPVPAFVQTVVCDNNSQFKVANTQMETFWSPPPFSIPSTICAAGGWCNLIPCRLSKCLRRLFWTRNEIHVAVWSSRVEAEALEWTATVHWD